MLSRIAPLARRTRIPGFEFWPLEPQSCPEQGLFKHSSGDMARSSWSDADGERVDEAAAARCSDRLYAKFCEKTLRSPVDRALDESAIFSHDEPEYDYEK